MRLRGRRGKLTVGEVANCQVADSLMPTLSRARNKNIGLILDRVGFFHDELLKCLQDSKQGAGRNWPCQERAEKKYPLIQNSLKQMRRDQTDLHLAVSS